jgi:hypothetical protein
MIRYTLQCDQDHRFESWFQSAEAFEKLQAARMVTCSDCGSQQVSKALMAPAVRPAKTATGTPSTAPSLSAPTPQAETAIAELKKHIEATSEYVGMNFVTEARAMHRGESPERAIYGEAKLADARALIEEGVPVAPLPFVPRRQTN